MAAFIAYDSVTKTYTIDPGASAADINLTIKNAPVGATIFFAAGNHVLTEQISVWRDNITLKGAGAGLTTLTVDQTGAAIGDGIRISGDKTTSWSGGLSLDVARGSHTITLTSTVGLKAGDILHVSQANDAAFLADGTYANVAGTSQMADNPLRESLVAIDHIDGNTVYLKQEIAYAMQGGQATVSRYGYLENVKVSDFTVTYNLPAADKALFENTNAAFDNKAAMSVERTHNIDIRNVEFKNVASHALEVRRSLEATVDHIKTDGALNKGSDGNGYSLHIAETFNSTFTNLELMNGRHAVVFSSWSAEAYNNVQVLMTNRDINYHGSPDHSNVVVIDRMVYEGGTDYTGVDRSWYAVGPGSNIHPASTISDNITVFKHLEAGAKDDTVYGWSGGSYLDTKAGNDTAIGDAGVDTLIGGIGDDILVGGGAADTFIFNVGDGNDVITDFQGGASGDKIILKNMLQFTTPGSVVLTQVGADSLLQLAGSNSILFKNFLASSFTAANVVLDNTISALDSTMVAGVDTLRGGALDDVVRMSVATWEKQDWIDLAAGVNDRVLVKGEGFYMNAASMARFSGVELIDLRSVTSGVMSLKVSDAMVVSAEAMRLKIAVGAVQTNLDTYGVLDGHEVHVYGAGSVTLASNGTQRATLESKLGTLNAWSGTGNDVIKVKGSLGVVLDSGTGSDTITIASNAAHKVSGGDGNDKFLYTFAPTAAMVLNGGAGVDTVQFSGNVAVGAVVTAGWTGIENLAFNGATNSVAISSALSGGFLNVEGIGGVRAVTLDVTGITAAQTIQMDENVNLTLSGVSSGAITVQLTSVTTGIFQGGAGGETVIGYGNADRLYGGAGNDTIDGAGGNDTIDGQDGNDTLKGGSGVDTVYGGNGNDWIDGGIGTDTLYGGSGDDTILGGSSTDYLHGDAGNDTLNGGLNGDYLYGGTGNDLFVIDQSDSRDVIYDFKSVVGDADRLDLQALFDANGLGALTFSGALTGGYLKLTQSGTDVNVGFDADGAAGSIFALKTVASLVNEVVGDLSSGNVLV